MQLSQLSAYAPAFILMGCFNQISSFAIHVANLLTLRPQSALHPVL
jgi:hypothetical protein